MGVISWIILGLIAGFIASKIVNRTGSGLIFDLVLGMVGAAVGGFIFSGIFGMCGRPQSLERHRLGDRRGYCALELRGSGREILIDRPSSSQGAARPPRRRTLSLPAILDGKQPADLTANKLIADTRLPLDWCAQRVALGIA